MHAQGDSNTFSRDLNSFYMIFNIYLLTKLKGCAFVFSFFYSEKCCWQEDVGYTGGMEGGSLASKTYMWGRNRTLHIMSTQIHAVGMVFFRKHREAGQLLVYMQKKANVERKP
ncbi:hypothetical protein ILYODFUR_036829 [Ilyodon furcidens]|uniref:Uncharacterized protein n=1 Tax=Ilyodon furcidens TaxID=33524 RepID=A0ABV0V9V4_9TELE